MSSQTTRLSAQDFKRAVALQFASRPTLRQVVGRKVLQLLVERHPKLSTVRPLLTDAEPLRLLIPQSGPGNARLSVPLIQVLLQALMDGTALNLEMLYEEAHGLYFVEPYRFEGSDGFEYIELKGITDSINDLLLELPYHVQQAQIDYWSDVSSAGVSRDRWLQQTLKLALLRNLPLQGLGDPQEACIYGLLKGAHEQPGVFTVEVQLAANGQRFLRMLPNLLVVGEWDEREVVLWCAPSSVVRAFDSLDDFASALQDEMASRYAFESMSWNRYELEGDPFSQQAALLLNIMLENLQRLHGARHTDVAEMEALHAALTDPAQWFIEGYVASGDASVAVAPGLIGASAADSFAYQCGLFELALAQAQSKGRAALDDVQDLHSYASARLRSQLLIDHPDDANYFPDDLNLTLTLTRGVPGGAGVGVGDGVVETRSMTLTQFAIGNLSSLQGATLTTIEHRNGQLIMDWLNVDYVRSLVEKVDIGGHYPGYVAQQLDDSATREQRVSCFAREWRCSLLFSALTAKLGGTLSEAGLQCVVDYCGDHVDRDLPGIMLMPLAFSCEPASREPDLVSGMYVLFSTEPATVLLYRPLYSAAALKEFASLEAMMAAIRQPGTLQDSILEWLKPQARRIYDHGGFSEPHLGRPILDTQLLPEPVKPASFFAQFWQFDVDAKLYLANRDLLVELADRQSVSSAESHWALLVQGAWLLFDVVTLLLRGPVASVAWLVQVIKGLESDVAALNQGSDFERSAAVVDLILNLGMAMFHARLPKGDAAPTRRFPDPVVFDGLPPGPGLASAAQEPAMGKQGLPGSLAERPGVQLDFTWRGRQGFNALPTEQRKALQGLRSGVSLNGVEALESGPERGLYRIGENYYTSLVGDTYLVEVSDKGVQVLGADGKKGPWLNYRHGQWRIDAGLRLLGGGPRRRADLLREDNQKEYDALYTQQADFSDERNRVAESFGLSKSEWFNRERHAEKLEAQRDKVPDNPAGRPLKLAFEQKIKLARRDVLRAKYQVMADLKAMIEADLKLDKVLTQLVQPKFARQKLMPAIKLHRSIVRQQVIENLVALYNDTRITINDIDVQELIDNMVARPISKTELEHYDYVRSMLESVVAKQLDLVWISKLLDGLLIETLKDVEIVFKDESGERQNKQVELDGLIEKRRLTFTDLQLELLEHLAELCLNRGAGDDEEALIRYHAQLWSDALKSAGIEHGKLEVIEVPAAQRLELLGGVLDSYKVAQGHAVLLAESGDEVIKTDTLNEYLKVLDTLIDSAQEEMAMAIRESELFDPVQPTTRVYRRRTGKHRVVKTHNGRSVIGEEVQVDGHDVVQQKDPSGTKVLKTFRKQQGVWVEDVEEPVDELQPSDNSHDVGVARSMARKALGQLEPTLELAQRYIGKSEPIGMQSIVEGLVERLKEAGEALESTGIAAEFGAKLSDAIERLENTQHDLLTSYYLTTSHPTATGLRFLFREKQISIRPTTRRKMLSANDYLDIYEVHRLPSRGNAKGTGIWEAHFHYPDATVPARRFAKGHLKIWSQRKIGQKAQMEAVRGNSRELLAVYRGNLVLSEVEGIIPFD
ncbi:hypothetical protein DM813_01750 [Pseudomonas alkylphenolica]|uniref:Dermonecrotic toxin N-terminal domain-containing protein n=1 Tax=Pseudomonas alkylphenolica TaxID=237609 RepID=A0A443ZZP1_9PSED|nr:DUF6543 domain-containing protein [Pseudomonas alkylphenolica]RWU26575.1 hypothetical protein DM813_01750 [Pseudomonas alkylphenolica]